MNLFDDSSLFCRGMLIVLAIGLIVRFAFGYLLEYNNDVTAWTQTLANIEAGAGLYNMAGYYYPPVWGYILGVFSEFIGIAGVDNWAVIFPQLLFVEDWEDSTLTTPAFNIALTVLLTVSDIIVSCLVYWLIKRLTGDMVKAKIGFAMFFLALNVMFVCGCWGQFDSFSALMALLCVCLLFVKKEMLAGMIFTMAALLKLFPAFLIFILVAYIVVKREDWKVCLLKAASGAAVMLVVLMLPSIMEGTVMDSLSFVFARVGSSGGGIAAAALKYTSLIIYPVIIILEAVIAFFFVKRRGNEDLDMRFTWFAFLSVMALFLYPSTAQYLILLMPFAIVAAIVHETRLVKPMMLLIIGSTLFMLPSFPMLLGSITMYEGLIPFDQWMDLYDLFYGGSPRLADVIGVVSATIQYVAWLWMAIVSLDHSGIDIKRIIRRAKTEPEQS